MGSEKIPKYIPAGANFIVRNFVNLGGYNGNTEEYINKIYVKFFESEILCMPSCTCHLCSPPPFNEMDDYIVG